MFVTTYALLSDQHTAHTNVILLFSNFPRVVLPNFKVGPRQSAASNPLPLVTKSGLTINACPRKFAHPLNRQTKDKGAQNLERLSLEKRLLR